MRDDGTTAAQEPGKKDYMTATAKSPKLSQTMEEALVYLGCGSYRAHLEPEKRTVLALERRGMIEWSETAEVGTTYDNTILWNVTATGWHFLWVAYSIHRPADAGRLTVEEALTDAEQIAEDDRTAAADWDAAYALEDAEELARVDATLDQAEADAKSRLDAVVKQQARDDRPKSAMTELAAEDFQPGYRYWAVRPGFEAAWTIASVEIRTAEYSVWRNGKEVTPELVVITRGDGTVRTLEKGEMVAIMGPWKTEEAPNA
jgi:hypothetical protein